MFKLLKKKNNPTDISVDGEVKKVELFSYFIYDVTTDAIIDSIKLTEEQAMKLTKYLRSKKIALVRS